MRTRWSHSKPSPGSRSIPRAQGIAPRRRRRFDAASPRRAGAGRESRPARALPPETENERSRLRGTCTSNSLMPLAHGEALKPLAGVQVLTLAIFSRSTSRNPLYFRRRTRRLSRGRRAARKNPRGRRPGAREHIRIFHGHVVLEAGVNAAVPLHYTESFGGCAITAHLRLVVEASLIHAAEVIASIPSGQSRLPSR